MKDNRSVRLKSVGEWRPQGKCHPNSSGLKCGAGFQVMTRDCTDGTVQKCTTSDRKTNRRCFLGDCLKELGEWKDGSLCTPNDNIKKCGEGKKLQTRICTNGTKEMCRSEDTIQYTNCFLECKKKLGPWIKGDCISNIGSQNCGDGQQIHRRSCEAGTYEPCLYGEMRKTTTCYLGDCLKALGGWKDKGACVPNDITKKCGVGKRIQTRTCKDGTNTVCRMEETIRHTTCFVECKKKFGPWIKGDCVSNLDSRNCGVGQQLQTRTCEAGTNDPCLYTETTKATQCYLGQCSTGKYIVFNH